jgi:beta-phosphoglucomutase
VKRVAFLFDNDGVLIDSSAFHWKSWQLLMEEVPEIKMDRLKFFSDFGKRNDLILKHLIPHIPEERRKEIADRKEALFRQCAQGNVLLLPGMENFLQKVVAAKIPHIIASSTPLANLEMYLRSTVLGRYFEHYISAEEVAHGKPAPDVFIAAAHRLGFEPTECVVFEDAQAGIDSGKAAGCFVVALETTASRATLSHYDMIYSSAQDLNLEEILSSFI